MKTYCLTLDLRDKPELIEEYKWHHQQENFWPELAGTILSQGILSEEIYLIETRLVMILQTTDTFSLAAKAASERANPIMQKWEGLMWKYQRPLQSAKPGEKWVLMEKIFDLKKAWIEEIFTFETEEHSKSFH
jgi:L-rhamnose mutarotase